MSATTARAPRRLLLQTAQLTAIDYRCTAQAGQRSEEEQHGAHCIAYVRRGTFGCVCRGRRFDLVAGSMLVGRPGDTYRCTHEHSGGGDECLSFRYAPALIAELGGTARPWQVGVLPPQAAGMVLGTLAQAAAAGQTDLALEEAGLLLAQQLPALADGRRSGTAGRVRATTAADRARVLRAALSMADDPARRFDLTGLAAQAGTSVFQFLRVFARVVGPTPHQYLIRCRLGTAAQLLATETLPVTQVALAAGFDDLSNFVRSFGRAAGLPPSRFRQLARGERSRLLQRLTVQPTH